jgi:hypothetical protein
MTFPWSPEVNIATFGVIATVVVGFPPSCPMRSWSTTALNMAFFREVAKEGVATTGHATLGFCFLCRVRWHLHVDLCQICLVKASFSSTVFSDILRLSCAKYIVFWRRRNAYRRGCRRGFRMCHIACHPEGHESLNTVQKLSLNSKSSPRLEPTTVFVFVPLVPLISSPKRTNFALAPFFSCA